MIPLQLGKQNHGRIVQQLNRNYPVLDNRSINFSMLIDYGIKCQKPQNSIILSPVLAFITRFQNIYINKH